MTTKNKHTACGQWISVENYYLRQLLGIDRITSPQEYEQLLVEHAHNDAMIKMVQRGYKNITLTRTHLHRAKEILASFDLVLIQEQMATPSTTTHYFYELIGPTVFTKYYYPTRNETIRATLPNELPIVRHGKERLNKEQYRPMNTNDRQLLEQWNALDIELYKYAVLLSKKQTEDYVRHKQQQQQHNHNHDNESSAVPPITVSVAKCHKPARRLSTATFDIVLGGNCCQQSTKQLFCPMHRQLSTKGFFYYKKNYHKCVLSSSDIMQRDTI